MFAEGLLREAVQTAAPGGLGFSGWPLASDLRHSSRPAPCSRLPRVAEEGRCVAAWLSACLSCLLCSPPPPGAGGRGPRAESQPDPPGLFPSPPFPAKVTAPSPPFPCGHQHCF